MASRIAGITVEIDGDTTGLSKALSSINTDLKSTSSQLEDVEKLLKLDPTNTELLAQKQKLLAEAIEETAEIVETEMYIDGYKLSLVKDTSYKGLWEVSFTLKEF